jgi:hypothetical protein
LRENIRKYQRLIGLRDECEKLIEGVNRKTQDYKISKEKVDVLNKNRKELAEKPKIATTTIELTSGDTEDVRNSNRQSTSNTLQLIQPNPNPNPNPEPRFINQFNNWMDRFGAYVLGGASILGGGGLIALGVLTLPLFAPLGIGLMIAGGISVVAGIGMITTNAIVGSVVPMEFENREQAKDDKPKTDDAISHARGQTIRQDKKIGKRWEDHKDYKSTAISSSPNCLLNNNSINDSKIIVKSLDPAKVAIQKMK